MTDKRFPIIKRCLYLNHAAVAPWTQASVDTVHTFALENAQQGTLNYPEWLIVEQQLRDYAQCLLNAPDAMDIALVKNTSEGLSFLAYGLAWQAGDNVVGIQQEFPSNRFVWQSLADKGVSFRQLDLTTCWEDPETALLALCDARTRVLSVSAVQYATGFRMDLARIGAFCQAHGIIFCVDAIQQLGALPFDVQAIQADVVVADGHKWLLGPEGLGLFYVKRALQPQLALTQYGWHMAAGLTDYSDLTFTVAPDARRFECGSPNMLGIHALHASLGVLLAEGMESVWAQLRERIVFLIDALQQLPEMEILSDMRPERLSGIVTFRSKTETTDVLYRRLQAHGILCAPRGGGIRFSPHFYTPFAQLQQVVDVLRLGA